MNAKTFNPPGTLYYTEADRIEAWALDHIAKASSTVIQYETDWNIDIEKDEDTNVNVDDDDEENPPTSIPLDDIPVNGRSSSVASQPQQSTGRRGPRGSMKKGGLSFTVSESIDNEGRLPGSKDGIGAFPSCSDWARTMVALKLKGMRRNCLHHHVFSNSV
jgi:bromodomain-containing protein 7/9